MAAGGTCWRPESVLVGPRSPRKRRKALRERSGVRLPEVVASAACQFQRLGKDRSRPKFREPAAWSADDLKTPPWHCLGLSSVGEAERPSLRRTDGRMEEP